MEGEPLYYYDCILDLLDVKKSSRILDVGCGGGFLLKTAEKRDMIASGVDFSSVVARKAKEYASQSEVVLADSENLCFKNEAFDHVSCLGSMEHFVHPDVALKEMVRVLRDGGSCCFVLPNSYFLKDIYFVWRKGQSPSQRGGQMLERFGTRMEWQELLEKNFLHILTVNKYNPKWRIKNIGTLIYRCLRPFIPLNLSYCFVFICMPKKNGRQRIEK